MEDQQRKHERVTFTLGIAVAAVIGFALNIYANIYYEVLLLGTREMSDYNQLATVIPFVVLVYSYEFLSFLIYDYKNTIILDRPFLKRFFEYHDNVFWLTKIVKGTYSLISFAFKWTFALVIGHILFQASGTQALLVWLGIIIFWLAGKYFYQKRFKTVAN